MATNAERQAAYRRRHLAAVDGQGERINIVVHDQAALRLKRLAAHYGVTQKAMLETLLADAEHALTATMTDADFKAYHITP